MSPQNIRPDQDFRLFVTIYKMYHHECDVRAVLSRDAVEYATETVTFTHTGTKQMLLKVFVTLCDPSLFSKTLPNFVVFCLFINGELPLLSDGTLRFRE